MNARQAVGTVLLIVLLLMLVFTWQAGTAPLPNGSPPSAVQITQTYTQSLFWAVAFLGIAWSVVLLLTRR